MRVEHIGFLVARPLSMAEWWVANLGFEVLRRSGDDHFGVCFLRDSSGTTLEFGNIPGEAALDLQALQPLQIHVAIDCADPAAEAKRLLSRGAIWIGESPLNERPGEKVLVRDPFGAVIQLVSRQRKLEQA